MILPRVLRNEENDNFNPHSLVLVNYLSALSFFPLLRVCFAMRPVTIFYFQASRFGLKLATYLKIFRLVSGEPRQIKDVVLCDTPHNVATEVRFESLKLCLKNQSGINELVEKIIPEFGSHFREVCATGVRKEWQIWLEVLLIQLNLAKVISRNTGILTHKVVLISHVASLLKILKVDPKISSGIKVYSQPFENKAQLYLWGPVFYSLGQVINSLVRSLLPPKKDIPLVKKRKSVVGVPAVWGFKGLNKNRDDDFFWWRQSSIPPEQLIYIFERPDFQPTRDRLADLEKMKIKAVALNPKFSGDITECKIGRVPSLIESLKRFFFYSRVAFLALFGDKFVRSVYSLTGWQIYKSEKLVSLYRDVNLRGVFHFNESGLEFVTLAALQSDAARIGAHWSVVNGPNASSPKCHEVCFIWGPHEAKISRDSGTIAKNILISGCFLNEHSHEEEYLRGQKAVQSMKKSGARYILALFDSSPPLPSFYQFFLQWLTEDPDLGILIKSKGDTWKSVYENGMGGLVQEAMDSGRIFVMDDLASPADAAQLSDFSVGISSVSAIAVAGLQGARVLYLDYEKLDQGALKPYSIFHSLGPKRCVFYDPESLKEAVLEYSNNPKSNPSLGDVSPILDQLDPFRDGKAGQRIGEYIAWYLDSLDQSSSKAEALRTATKKYAEKWGNDKVIRCES